MTNNYCFYAIVEDIKIPIQILAMNSSYFVYVGNNELSFDNMYVAFYNDEVFNNLFC